MKKLITYSFAALGLAAAGLAAAQTPVVRAAQDIEEIIVVARSPAFEVSEQLQPWLRRDLGGQILAGVESLHDERYSRIALSGTAEEEFAAMITRQWKRWVSEETL